jgi:hypothetical protein
MNLKLAFLLPTVLVITGCTVVARPGGGLVIVPVLPSIVEVGDDSYYAHNGYHYWYTGDRWFYSSSFSGPRMELPRSHWPQETRHRGGERR